MSSSRILSGSCPLPSFLFLSPFLCCSPFPIKAPFTSLMFHFISPTSCCPSLEPFPQFLCVFLVSDITPGHILTSKDLELGTQVRDNMWHLSSYINSLNIWSLLGMISCKNQVLCIGILASRILLNSLFFLFNFRKM